MTAASQAINAYEISSALIENADEIIDIMLGNDERVQELNNETLLAAEFAAGVIDVIKNEVSEQFYSDYKKGWPMLMVIFSSVSIRFCNSLRVASGVRSTQPAGVLYACSSSLK